ncbi:MULTISPECIES: CPBP family intramembrane glutamic endopeptidase [unclassified Flavobacterium]|uniref:CPBP family intramembrane glutamic endopeptidase n=1 Tax=unclassified Flavobacterium TaxID=196869 RepID=UPI001F13B606|nr:MULTISPECIES: CPBP family intramembrane glutamic endopeptidase [unclassified Flavobacterium]UMY66299.1 CPBP family intramembrane metalloprotease [Flavobacterium sp. HJ-32-4]
MFLRNGFGPNSEIWRYILGSAFIIIMALVGILPFEMALAMRFRETGVAITETNMLSYLEPNATLFFNLVPYVFALGGIWVVARYFHGQPFRELVTARPAVDWKRIFLAFALWGCISGGCVVVAYFVTPEDFAWNFCPVPFAIMALISITLLPIQTSVEELIFRGYLMQGFAALARNRWFPLALTSLIFGLLHGFNPEVAKLGPAILIYYVGTGLFLGVLTLMDDGTELALGFHAANNLVTALLVTADWTALQTNSVWKDVSEPSLSFEVFFPVVVLFPLLLLIFSKLYKWSDWKEKLTGKLT